MRQRLISGLVHIVVAASCAFAALGIASVMDSAHAKSLWLFSCVFVLMLCLSLAVPKE